VAWPARVGHHCSMGERLTVIVTQFVTADELPDEHGPVPLFIEDGVEAPEPGTGIRTSLARMVERISFESSQVEDDNGEIHVGRKTVVDFADGTASRTFDPDDIVEIRRIIPGVDLEQDV
jgi:hypothetical protein